MCNRKSWSYIINLLEFFQDSSTSILWDSSLSPTGSSSYKTLLPATRVGRHNTTTVNTPPPHCFNGIIDKERLKSNSLLVKIANLGRRKKALRALLHCQLWKGPSRMSGRAITSNGGSRALKAYSNQKLNATPSWKDMCPSSGALDQRLYWSWRG